MLRAGHQTSHHRVTAPLRVPRRLARDLSTTEVDGVLKDGGELVVEIHFADEADPWVGVEGQTTKQQRVVTVRRGLGGGRGSNNRGC